MPIVTLGFALFLAFMITQKVRFSSFYRVTFFFPQVMSVVAIGILWSFIYHPSIGILNSFLKGVGIESPPVWLGNPQTASGGDYRSYGLAGCWIFYGAFYGWDAGDSPFVLRSCCTGWGYKWRYVF